MLTNLISSSIANEDYFEFTVAPEAGTSLDLKSLGFRTNEVAVHPIF
ncbi:MAG: hypothetical protein HC896_03605 [Bacteroidales bacterium]|nr:hypothetical protein [Bacteroidales bacterium]